MLNFCQKLIDFSPLPEEMYNYKKTETLLMMLQTLQLVLLWVRKLTLDQTAVMNLSKLFLSAVIVRFLNRENITTSVDFACGITFYSEASTNVGQINRERKNIFRSWEKPRCMPSNLAIFRKKIHTGRKSEQNICCCCDEPQLSLSVAICLSCLISFVCWCKVRWFFALNFFSVPFLWWLWVRSKMLSTTTM